MRTERDQRTQVNERMRFCLLFDVVRSASITGDNASAVRGFITQLQYIPDRARLCSNSGVCLATASTFSSAHTNKRSYLHKKHVARLD